MINPEAGSHPITTDAAELSAVSRASDRSLERFPYYGWRYGERGRRFGASDGAWLVTLLDGTDEQTAEQIDWLGRVLAARGMPTLLLEAHLEIRHEELLAAEGAPPRRHDLLLANARRLGGKRAERLDPERASSLAGELVRRVPEALEQEARQMGPLIVAAVADEAGGHVRAVESLMSWVTDPECFPPSWIEAVHWLAGEARRSLKPAP